MTDMRTGISELSSDLHDLLANLLEVQAFYHEPGDKVAQSERFI